MSDVALYPTTDPRFGRHRVHDPQSRAFDLAELNARIPRREVNWPRRGEIFDQGNCPSAVLATLGADPEQRSIGCCTMCAAYGLLLTEPYFRPGTVYTLDDVLKGYHRETVLDDREIPGVWPPEDTGSAGLYAMKVLRDLGLIRGYRHAFTLASALAALGRGPVAVGTNWYDSMFTPVARNGRPTLEIAYGASVVGGHEYILDRIDPKARMVGMTNSWGTGWGAGGRAWMSWSTLERLLHEHGDVVMPSLPLSAVPD